MATEKKKTSTALVVPGLSAKSNEMMAMAEVLAVSRVVPAAYAANPPAIFAAIQYGREFGIPPMTALQNIAVINGRPTMSTDLLAAVAHRHPEWGGYEIVEQTSSKCTVIVYRVYKALGKTIPFKSTYTIEEAREAGLVRPNSPWVKWGKRMLKHRAFGFSLRDAFPDAVCGNYTYEEMEPEKFAQTEEQFIGFDDELHASKIDDEGPSVKLTAKVSKTPTAKKTAKKL